jgi:hypothetical protein
MTLHHRLLASTLAALLLSSVANAAITYDDNVTPEFINGSGNANGSFTVDRANGVEIGLRGKLRHNAMGQPENTFNSNGDGTYSFDAIVAPTQVSPTAVWSYEWTINTNYDGSTSYALEDLTYELSLDTDPGPGVSFLTFDPIHFPNPATGLDLWDHAMGDNSTPNGGGVKALTEPQYAANIALYNVAQQSWKAHWYIPGFDPTTPGEYTISLTAFDGMGAALASSSIVINAVPEPGSIALVGLAGLFGTAVYLRRRWA